MSSSLPHRGGTDSGEDEAVEVAKCEAEAAGYDSWFGIYCSRPAGHEGPHEQDGYIRWEFVGNDPWRVAQ